MTEFSCERRVFFDMEERRWRGEEERRRGELLMEKKRDQAPAYIP